MARKKKTKSTESAVPAEATPELEPVAEEQGPAPVKQARPVLEGRTQRLLGKDRSGKRFSK